MKKPGLSPARSTSGFTLVELMVVIVIVSVLSAVAIPTFSSYVQKSRTSEAVEFLGVIRLREEAFRAEFGTYCPTLANTPTDVTSIAAQLVPTNPGRDPQVFVPTAQWLQLGARPTSTVRFGYGVAGGAPDTAPTALGWTPATADFWFVAQAVGDLDGDNDRVTFEIYSASRNMWVGGDGEASSKGWE